MFKRSRYEVVIVDRFGWRHEVYVEARSSLAARMAAADSPAIDYDDRIIAIRRCGAVPHDAHVQSFYAAAALGTVDDDFPF